MPNIPQHTADQQQDEPIYLRSLELTRAPFAVTIEDELFFRAPAQKRSLDQLLHLGQYSDLIINVCSPPGSGKTTLLNQFIFRAGKHLHTCLVKATSSVNDNQIIQALTQEFNLQVTQADRETQIANLQHQLRILDKKSIITVLLIDDAHLLPSATFDLITQLANIANGQGKFLLHILLFAEPQIEAIVGTLYLKNRIKRLDIAPFSRPDTEQYLRYRFMQVGQGSGHLFASIFKPAVVAKIHKHSQGLPAHINQLAHRRLDEFTIKSKPQTNRQQTRRWSKKQLVTVSFGVIVLTLALIFQERINMLFVAPQISAEMMAPGSQTIGSDQLAGVTIAKWPDAIVDQTGTIELLDELVEQDNPMQLDAGAAFPATTPPGEQILSAIDVALLVAPDHPVVAPDHPVDALDHPEDDSEPVLPESSLVTEKQPSRGTQDTFPETVDIGWSKGIVQTGKPATNQTAPTSGDTVPVAANKPAPAPTTRRELKRESWFLKQRSKHYAVQIFATDSEAEIFAFIQKYQLHGDNLAYFRAHYKKRGDWYSLVLGVYPGVSKARQAIEKLPKSLAKEAWIRRVRIIQANIKKAR